MLSLIRTFLSLGNDAGTNEGRAKLAEGDAVPRASVLSAIIEQLLRILQILKDIVGLLKEAGVL